MVTSKTSQKKVNLNEFSILTGGNTGYSLNEKWRPFWNKRVSSIFLSSHSYSFCSHTQGINTNLYWNYLRLFFLWSISVCVCVCVSVSFNPFPYLLIVQIISLNSHSFIITILIVSFSFSKLRTIFYFSLNLSIRRFYFIFFLAHCGMKIILPPKPSNT